MVLTDLAAREVPGWSEGLLSVSLENGSCKASGLGRDSAGGLGAAEQTLPTVHTSLHLLGCGPILNNLR